MNYIIPNPLQKGDTIGLIAPSSPPQPGRLEVGMQYLKNLGFSVKVGRHLHKADRFLAGSDEHRALDIMEFIIDPEVKAIIAIAGGYGSQRVLPLLDFELIKKNPKIITGFSDTTALQLGLLKKSGLVSYSGFTFRDVDKPDIDSLLQETLISMLTDNSVTLSEGIVIHEGKVQAPLIGGNLECMMALMGTPFQPDYCGSILLIEDVFSEPMQTDSRLSQLYSAGIFDQAAGVIFGIFQDCIARNNPERDGTIEDVITEWSKKIKVPAIKAFPYGHIDRRCMLPIGKEIVLDASDRKKPKVTF